VLSDSSSSSSGSEGEDIIASRKKTSVLPRVKPSTPAVTLQAKRRRPGPVTERTKLKRVREERKKQADVVRGAVEEALAGFVAAPRADVVVSLTDTQLAAVESAAAAGATGALTAAAVPGIACDREVLLEREDVHRLRAQAVADEAAKRAHELVLIAMTDRQSSVRTRSPSRRRRSRHRDRRREHSPHPRSRSRSRSRSRPRRRDGGDRRRQRTRSSRRRRNRRSRSNRSNSSNSRSSYSYSDY
jgi:hypothetical protein